jgi:outer membrane protein OmpA-like peptidoglycan-associated protein
MILVMSFSTACGASQSAEPAETSRSQPGQERAAGGADFQVSDSDTAGQAHGERPSEIVATRTEAAMRLFVVNADTGPIQGIVIKMTAPDGTAYYTGQTDSLGYAEVLVPVGQRYAMEYLSLGRRNTTANVEVPAGPHQDIRLTMRYRRIREAAPAPRARTPETAPGAQDPAPEAAPEPPGLVLDGILFATGSAVLQAESFPRLDRVVEYMTYKPSARVLISGHTDNVGNAATNQRLSQTRADAVREYLVSHGIDGSRVEAIGYGDQRPVASNDTEEGQRLNRRIEAVER